MTIEALIVLTGIFLLLRFLFAYSNKVGYPRVECKKHTWKANLVGGHYCSVCKLDTRKSLGEK